MRSGFPQRFFREKMTICQEGMGLDVGISKNRGTPKSSILIGFSIINHPFSGTRVPLFLETPMHTEDYPLDPPTKK